MDYGELTGHFSHPQHKLNWEKSDLIFTCGGCRQVGTGFRFHCSLCDFNLHTDCAAASLSGTALRHRFYPKSLFDFFREPPGSCSRHCNACRQNVAGFVYHCCKSGYDLHPCCAALPPVINADDGRRLHLHHQTSAPCDWCKRKDKKKSWCYRSDCKKYNLHVACVSRVTEMLLDDLHEPSSGSGGNGIVILSGNTMPIVKAAGNGHHRSWEGKVKKCCKMVAIVVRFVIAALLGDPTVAIAGIVHSLLSE